MSLCGPQSVPPTQKSAKYVFIIKIIMALQVLISLANIVAYSIFLRQGIFGLCFLFLLYYAYYKLSYLCVLVYTFVSIFFAIQFLVFAMTMQVFEFYCSAQRGEQYANLQNSWVQYYLIIAGISCLFYIFNSVFFYYPYKEFKTIQFFQNPAFNQVMTSSATDFQNNRQLNQVNTFGQNNNNRDRNTGRTTSRNNPRNPNPSPNPNNNNVQYIDYGHSSQNNRVNVNGGTFEVFKGQGIRIG